MKTRELLVRLNPKKNGLTSLEIEVEPLCAVAETGVDNLFFSEAAVYPFLNFFR